ncbi:MAG TPA: CHRD domain-containing protein [Nitrososphaeraceae archaeon]
MKASEKILVGSLPYVLIIASVVLSVHLLNSNSMLYAAENLDRYWSILTGDQQTPPVTTDAIGYVGLKFQDDRTRLMYIVNAEHIGKVTAVYLYQIGKTQNGTIVSDLLHSPRELKSIDKVVDKTPQGKTKGTVSMGAVISDDLQRSAERKNIV